MISVTVTLKHYKTNTNNTPIIICLNSCQDLTKYPVHALHLYTQKFGHTSGPLFQLIDGHPVSYSFVTKQLSSAVSFIGLDPRLYKRHSFRIGAATHAARLGYSENSIQKMGRWNSDAIKKYIRLDSFHLWIFFYVHRFLKALFEGQDFFFYCNTYRSEVICCIVNVLIPFLHRCIHFCI